MIRTVSFLLGLGVAAAPAAASTYSATLAVPASGSLIERDISWNCGPAACLGATDESRPLVLCESLAKRAGRIESFVVNGRAFAPADLERCNAFARPQPAQTIADK